MDDNEIKERLRLVEFARKYSIEQLGFDKDHMFEVYAADLKEFYSVLLSPRTDLKLHRYRFHDKRAAEDFMEKWGDKFDVYLKPLAAVGEREDMPITERLLECDIAFIAYVVPHEKWHSYVGAYTRKGGTNCLLLEESIGNAIALTEAADIVKGFYGPESREYEKSVKSLEKGKKHEARVNSIVKELDMLYSSSMTEPSILEGRIEIYEKYGFEPNNSLTADYYMYTALSVPAEHVYSTYGRDEAMEIFVSVLKTAKRKGFKKGVEKLLRYYGGDKSEYRDAINVRDW